MDAKTTGPLHDPAKEPAALRSLLGRTNRDWWPNQLSLEILHQHGRHGNPMGEDFDYASEFESIDYAALKRDLTAIDDRQPALVAGRLRPLRPLLHPHGLAQRRHLSHRRRPRRRLVGHAALRPAQLLAGQRQSRQGAPPALADQAEIRPQVELGGPDDPGRQRRHRIDGRPDLRLRRRPRGRLGARRRTSIGAPRRNGSASPGTTRNRAAPSKTRSPRSRWASSTSIPRARAATPIR